LGYPILLLFYLKAEFVALKKSLPQRLLQPVTLSNIIFKILNKVMTSKILKLKYIDTDDLTFSGDKIPSKFIEYATIIR
jgi:hypothetical protein